LELAQNPLRAVTHTVHVRLRAQSSRCGGRLPERADGGDAPQAGAVARRRRILRACQAQPRFAPHLLFPTATIRAGAGCHDDRNHAPIQLRDQGGGGLWGSGHTPRTELRAVGERLLPHALDGDFHAVVFRHPGRRPRETFLRPAVHQHALQSPRTAPRPHAGSFTERAEQLAAPAPAPLPFGHGDPPERRLPLQEFFLP
jgi:hypothetical protein